MQNKLLKSVKNPRKILKYLFFSTISIFIFFIMLNSAYLTWDYSNNSVLILGTILHSFEWVFMRIVPFILIGITIAAIKIKHTQKIQSIN